MNLDEGWWAEYSCGNALKLFDDVKKTNKSHYHGKLPSVWRPITLA